jgi:hypothetical protein
MSKASKNEVKQLGEAVNSTVVPVAEVSADYVGGVIGGVINEKIDSSSSAGGTFVSSPNLNFEPNVVKPDATLVKPFTGSVIGGGVNEIIDRDNGSTVGTSVGNPNLNFQPNVVQPDATQVQRPLDKFYFLKGEK